MLGLGAAKLKATMSSTDTTLSNHWHTNMSPNRQQYCLSLAMSDDGEPLALYSSALLGHTSLVLTVMAGESTAPYPIDHKAAVALGGVCGHPLFDVRVYQERFLFR